jgi:hypothetical protein
MKAWNGPMVLPQYHADLIKYPHETWKDYETHIQLAYEGAGATDLDPKVKRAHILTGLHGKARQMLAQNPHFMNLEYDDLLIQLRLKFDQPKWQSIRDIGNIIQKPGETVAEFVARLREAARAIHIQDSIPLLSKKEAKKQEEEGKSKAMSAEDFKDIYKDVLDEIIFRFFMTGLRKDLHRVVMQSQASTLKEAIEIAEKHERYTAIFGLQNQMANLAISGSRPEEEDSTVSKAAAQLQALNAKGSAQHLTTRPYMSPDKQDQKCFFCEKHGHFAREC